MTEGRELPPPALEMGITSRGLLPPPWFVPVEAPACGDELHVPAKATTDGIERRFACDKIAGHDDDEHRQVIDNDEGTTLVWTRRSKGEIAAKVESAAEPS